ncbi:uncharacterized protein LOC112539575 [Tetranychus urticae]|uniref:uncharacterized protein LOC112539575 n=1 Tax=Tetranychus urticae TaxID=32264 RepID=UPI000D641B9D|nr:uncharacterized protein LOC112539575 [Tetranychus urticae]
MSLVIITICVISVEQFAIVSKMNIFLSFFCKSTIGLPLMMMAIILGLPSSRSAPFKEAKLLRPIADQYSAPLDVSFLHSTIHKNTETISKIKNGLEDLSKLDVFGLPEISNLSDEQLPALEKANYFDFNKTETVKYLFEKFILQNEMYPIEFGSYGVVKVAVTPDVLLEDLPKKRSHDLIDDTNRMIQTYLTDIDKKQRSSGSNIMQKLAAFLARQELQLLANHSYPPGQNNYNYYDVNNPTKVALGTVLRKVKTIVDFFYAQFNHFADPKSSEKVNEVLHSLKYIASIHQIMITTITMILMILLRSRLAQY